jgi:hypothetical protein
MAALAGNEGLCFMRSGFMGGRLSEKASTRFQKSGFQTFKCFPGKRGAHDNHDVPPFGKQLLVGAENFTHQAAGTIPENGTSHPAGGDYRKAWIEFSALLAVGRQENECSAMNTDTMLTKKPEIRFPSNSLICSKTLQP